MQDLIDIGLNLTHDSFDADRADVLARAREAGVAQMIVTGTTVEESRAALSLTHESAGLFATAGVHPHHASEFDADTPAALRQLLDDPRVVAVGECGLDFFRNFSPPEAQERAFLAQLELAVELQLPVFLHQRDALDRFLGILADYLPRLPAAVAHCFTGGPEEAEACLAAGLDLGITGWICDERRGQALREAVRMIPGENLMVETDAPFLIPRDLRPKPKTRRNEPVHLPHILATVAECRGETPEALAAQTTANARRIFGLE